jgi:hypothetical protein
MSDYVTKGYHTCLNFTEHVDDESSLNRDYTSYHNVKQIALTKGQFALVDASNFDALNQVKWYATPHGRTFYAVHGFNQNGKTKHIFMHRLILGTPPGIRTDHADGNGLNNTRTNLRIATASQNVANKRKWLKPTSSQFKGVGWNKGKWRAYLQCDGRFIHLGLFDTEHDAALAYNSAALQLFGEFAKLNTFSKYELSLSKTT